MVPKSKTEMMCGWFGFAIARASRRKRSANAVSTPADRLGRKSRAMGLPPEPGPTQRRGAGGTAWNSRGARATRPGEDGQLCRGSAAEARRQTRGLTSRKFPRFARRPCPPPVAENGALLNASRLPRSSARRECEWSHPAVFQICAPRAHANLHRPDGAHRECARFRRGRDRCRSDRNSTHPPHDCIPH